MLSSRILLWLCTAGWFAPISSERQDDRLASTFTARSCRCRDQDALDKRSSRALLRPCTACLLGTSSIELYDGDGFLGSFMTKIVPPARGCSSVAYIFAYHVAIFWSPIVQANLPLNHIASPVVAMASSVTGEVVWMQSAPSIHCANSQARSVAAAARTTPTKSLHIATAW